MTTTRAAKRRYAESRPAGAPEDDVGLRTVPVQPHATSDELKRIRSELKSVREELVKTLGESRDARATLERVQGELVRVRDELRRAQDEVGEARRELEVERGENASLAQESQALKSSSERANAEVDEIKKENERLQKEIEELNDVVAGIRACNNEKVIEAFLGEIAKEITCLQRKLVCATRPIAGERDAGGFVLCLDGISQGVHKAISDNMANPCHTDLANQLKAVLRTAVKRA